MGLDGGKVHRRTGGLEGNTCFNSATVTVHRRTGGLEGTWTRRCSGGYVHRRTGGLEVKDGARLSAHLVHRRTGGLEADFLFAQVWQCSSPPHRRLRSCTRL